MSIETIEKLHETPENPPRTLLPSRQTRHTPHRSHKRQDWSFLHNASDPPYSYVALIQLIRPSSQEINIVLDTLVTFATIEIFQIAFSVGFRFVIAKFTIGTMKAEGEAHEKILFQEYLMIYVCISKRQ